MKFKVALLGKNNISLNILEILKSYDNLIDLVLVVPNNSDSGIDGWQKSLLKKCNDLGIHWRKFDKIKSFDNISYLKSLNLDFLFSAQYDQIINFDVIKTAKFGAINIHFAPLPKYRGVSPIAWALINGEREFGVTIHYMDPGIDTGDIISQVIFDIDNISSARDLYDKCVEKGTLLFEETLPKILSFSNHRLPQDNSKALYFSKNSIDFSKNLINFNKDTRSLYNWIRGFIFPPFQYPKMVLENVEKNIISASPDYRKNNFEKPGTIIERERNYLKVATHDSYINLIIEE